MTFIELTPPGQMLKEDFLEVLNIKAGTFAKAIGMDRTAIKNIIEGRRAITAEMSIRFGLFFGMSEGYWLNLQNDYDLRKAKQERLEEFRALVKPLEAA